MSDRPIQILLVEDNPADIALMRRLFARNRIVHELHVAETAGRAIAFLEHKPPYASAITPDVVLLDLGLPDLHGYTILKTMKENAELSGIPVIVLTGSQSPEDLAEARRLRANALLEKPRSEDEFAKLVDALEHWLDIVHNPQPY